ncbi:hypothetical protein CLAFUW4_13177 [Fulvia fulva]|uniref:Uncharacterized protein n=1 Tax=Passalora fulva TaxID=5499 RepID=A0A9Q8PJ64_PASFU|nr:uncharacterized protein CLAFUR5_13034 [Fulvia fulva]KAK4612120.1 hypothetical protein CLAFUR4_13182 [Fulvia fulva]UJO23475.1 hypothetical protein CLAFUR5_13034 [Fulvia fulva]WPV21339.1 hypothetical protein CLAFUW4_13177 [Fulvia fulva]WPV36123.1 hypothetical protein CLAFUW7_13185 [Fulvia fulva]
MQLPSILSIAVLLGSVAANPLAQYYGKPPGYGKPAPSCPADKCFNSIKQKPAEAKVASAFCSQYIIRKPCIKTTMVKTTKTITTTSKTTVIPDKATSRATFAITPTPATVSPTCTTTTTAVEGTFTTERLFTYQGTPPAGGNQKRAAPTIPSMSGAGCGTGKPLTLKISSACSCLLGTAKTSVSTSTSTILTTVTVTSSTTEAAMTTTVSVSVPLDQVTSCQTATTTTTTFANGAGRTCGAAPPVAAYTTGRQISCTAPAPAGQTNYRFRIEGNTAEGTTFDGCIITGPENITTPSGGTHLCDGTNNNNNPTPGGTLTTAINDTGQQEGFGFDGSYSNQFRDFFITRIRDSAQTGSQYWGVLRDRVFTNAGGCQKQTVPGTEGLWAFDAFNANAFLNLDSQYAVVQPGAAVLVTVTQTDGNGSGNRPAAGATLAGATSDSNGIVLFTAPIQDGCYQYKAERSGAIRSQIFYLSVVSGL